MSRGIEGIKEGHTTHQVEKKPLSLQYILKGHEDHKGELNGDRGDTGPDSTGVGDGKSDPDSHKPNTTEQSKLEQSGMPKPNDKQYNVGEAKGLDLHEYERNIVFPQENVHREEINTLFTTTLNEAISEKSNFKGLLEDAIRPKLDVENMRAFWHNKTGRILIGSAEHVSKIFENYGIVNQGLGTLKVGDKNNGITRIRIDDSLVNNILKKKGFKFDITKPGAHGELEKIATVHAKYNEDEDKMDVDFKE